MWPMAGALWSPCKSMNSLRVLQFCVNIMLSSLPLALFWSFSRLGICGSGFLVQMPRCRAVYVCADLFAYFPIHEIQRLSGFHIAARILALVPVCVCGRVSFQGICLEMHPGGGAVGRQASVFSVSLQRSRAVLSSHSCLVWRPSLMASHFRAGFPSHLGLRNALHASGYS